MCKYSQMSVRTHWMGAGEFGCPLGFWCLMFAEGRWTAWGSAVFGRQRRTAVARAGNLVIQTWELWRENVGSQWGFFFFFISTSLASIYLFKAAGGNSGEGWGCMFDDLGIEAVVSCTDPKFMNNLWYWLAGLGRLLWKCNRLQITSYPF